MRGNCGGFDGGLLLYSRITGPMLWGTPSSLGADGKCCVILPSNVLWRALGSWRQGYLGGYGSLILSYLVIETDCTEILCFTIFYFIHHYTFLTLWQSSI